MPEQREAPISLRLPATERGPLRELAQLNERPLNGEIRRALRYYVDHFDEVDRAIREEIRARLGV